MSECGAIKQRWIIDEITDKESVMQEEMKDHRAQSQMTESTEKGEELIYDVDIAKRPQHSS